MQKRTEYNVSPAEFVKAWNDAATSGGGIEQVAKATGMPVGICHDRASKYRKLGVKLKRMPRTRPPRPGLDVQGLNRLIDELDRQLRAKSCQKKTQARMNGVRV